MIVAVDTSSAVTVMGTGSLAGPGVRARMPGGRRHAEGIDLLFADTISPAISDVTTVEAIAVGIGPGPYSGLRVGIAFAIGLGRAWSVPVLGVCSLDARAWQCARSESPTLAHGTFFAITADARRSEVYWARYSVGDRVQRIAGPMVLTEIPRERTFEEIEIDPSVLAHEVAVLLASGVKPHPVEGALVPHGNDAQNFALGTGPLFHPTPLYLRQPDVTLPAGPGS